MEMPWTKGIFAQVFGLEGISRQTQLGGSSQYTWMPGTSSFTGVRTLVVTENVRQLFSDLDRSSNEFLKLGFTMIQVGADPMNGLLSPKSSTRKHE